MIKNEQIMSQDRKSYNEQIVSSVSIKFIKTVAALSERRTQSQVMSVQ